MSMIERIWADPFIPYLMGFTGCMLLIYFILAAFFESYDRAVVVEKAKEWAERRDRRRLREESADLWDSVNHLRRGQQAQGLDDKIPAYKRSRKEI
jgi:hypothetical protein